MNPLEFLKLVADMRQAQILFYKDRSRINLIRAKDLEKKVDEAIKTGIELVAAPRPVEKQATLFKAEGEQ